MGDRLFVGVLGHQDAGKSKTWYNLFGKDKLNTGTKPRKLALYDGECVEVFLVNGSFEERGLYAGELLDDQTCKIALCSIQYCEEARRTLNYVVDADFDFYVQWLNPGHKDHGETFDHLGFVSWLVGQSATICMRDGQVDATLRTEEIRQLIYGWAKARGLTFKCSDVT